MPGHMRRREALQESAFLISPLVCQYDLDECNLSARTDLIESEERVNVDCRRWGTSVVKIRILLAGLVLLAMGCAFLGWGTRLGKTIGHHSSSQAFLDGLEQSAQLKAHAHSIMAGLPLVFEPNQGQANLDPADAHARFLTHGTGYSLVLGSDGAILSLASRTDAKKSAAVRSETFQMKIGGAVSARLTATDKLPGKSNYFIGSDPAKWRTGIPQFGRVQYENLYPGINLVFYGTQGQLEYDFQIAPGADPSQAELDFSGAQKIELKDGALVLRGQNGSVQFDAPRIYQEIDGRKQPVEGTFVLRAENRVGFAIGAYDHSRELIIDPTLSFSSYFGGTGDEHNTSVAVDGSLNLYLTGSTTSPSLPTLCSYPGCTALSGTQNVYVAKIQPPLQSIAPQIMQLSYLGGSGTDYPVGIGVDGGGNPYVAGTTTSGNFPTTSNAYQASASGTHVFVTKIRSDFGELLYSSYLSGNGTDIASGMTIDNQSNLYVTGTTTSIEASSSAQFPASNAPQTLPFQSLPRVSAGMPQFFVTKVYTNAGGIASIPYSTYFGGGTFNGTLVATGGGIAVDTNSNVYFTGTTNFTFQGCTGCSVTDFPILNAYQPCLDLPPASTSVNNPTCANAASASLPDAFVAKLNTSRNVSPGQQLIWSTYIGGTGSDSGVGVAIDPGAANVYVVGTTDSPDFVNSSLVKSFGSFQACLNNTTITPASGTVTSCAAQATPTPTDAFVARLTNPSIAGTNLVTQAINYFSYLGGAGAETGNAITVDSTSGALITGSTTSPSSFTSNLPNAGTFPVSPFPSSIQSQLSGAPCAPCQSDAFLARLNTAATIGQTTTASWASYFGGTGTDAGTGIALDVNQDIYLAGESNSSDLPVPKAFQPNNNGGFDSFVAQFSPAFTLTLSGVLNLAANQHYISAGNPATFTYTVTNNGPDLASNIAILANFTSTGVPVSNVSATISTGTCGGGGSSSTSISCGPISLQSGSTATVTITLTPSLSSTAAPPVYFNGGTIQAIGANNIVLASASVTAQVADFGMTISPTSQAIPVAGATATYTVQLNPEPLYSSSITVSCSGLPAASSCPSKTASLSSASGATVALAVTTTARPATTPAASLFKRHFYALWLMVPAMALVGAGGNRRRRRLLGFLALFTLFALTLLIPACSSSKSTTPPAGTPAGNYTITITAAAGSDSKTQTVGLTVP